MGRNVSNSSSNSAAAQPMYYTTFTAGEDIPQGKIAVLGEDGLAYYAEDPALPASLVRPIVQTIRSANLFPNASPASPIGSTGINSTNGSSVWSGTNQIAGTALSNGNYVVAWQVTGSKLVQFAIFNNVGVQQGAVVTVDPTAASTATGFGVSIAALNGGGFVLAMSRDVAPWCQYGVYDNNGGVVKALTVVNANITSAATQITALTLSNGGFALVYMSTAQSVQSFATYNASGALTSGPTALGGASGSGAVSAAAFTAAQGGGFVVAYSTPTTGVKVQKFSNTGAPVGAANSTGAANYSYAAVAVLAGGGYAVAFTTSSNTLSTLAFNAAGNAVGAAQTVTTATSSGVQRIVALAGGDYATAQTSSGSGATLTYWSGTTGLVTKTWTYAQLPLTYSSNAEVAIYPTKAGGVSIIAGLSGGSLSAVYDSAGNLVNSITTIPAGYIPYGNTQPCVFPIVSALRPDADLCVVAGALSTGALFVGQFIPFVQKVTPVGVSTGAATKGQPVQVQYTGVAALAASFSQPYSLDAMSNTPPGQRMNVLGNSVLLSGIQSATRNRRTIN